MSGSRFELGPCAGHRTAPAARRLHCAARRACTARATACVIISLSVPSARRLSVGDLRLLFRHLPGYRTSTRVYFSCARDRFYVWALNRLDARRRG